MWLNDKIFGFVLGVGVPVLGSGSRLLTISSGVPAYFFSFFFPGIGRAVVGLSLMRFRCLPIPGF